MPNTLAEQLRELTTTVTELHTELRVLADRVERLQTDVSRQTARLDEVLQRITRVEERCTALEKHTDRGWNLTQALIILVLSVVFSAVTSFLTQTLLKK